MSQPHDPQRPPVGDDDGTMTSRGDADAATTALDDRIQRVRQQVEPPTFGLLGKAGAGKSSIVRLLTGLDEVDDQADLSENVGLGPSTGTGGAGAEAHTKIRIGDGFRPCTRLAAQYDFPDAAGPVMRFLDTRGLGEIGYDPTADLIDFADRSHLIIAVVRVGDQAVDDVLAALTTLRRNDTGRQTDTAGSRPVLLVLTWLHEVCRDQTAIAWSDEPWPSVSGGEEVAELRRAVERQYERFRPHCQAATLVDLTPLEWGLPDPEFGAADLRRKLLELLPDAQRRVAGVTIEETSDRSTGLDHVRILSYATAAATAAAVPLPWVEVPVVAGLQWRMTDDIAGLHGQTLDRTATARMSGLIGTRAAIVMGIRSLLKGVPILGSAINATAAFATTYAAGAAADYYFRTRAERRDDGPDQDAVAAVYREQLQRAMTLWQSH